MSVRTILAAWLALQIMSFPVTAEPVRQVHILSIGNGHYGADQSGTGLDPTGAPLSARIALEYMERFFGSSTKHLLLSDTNQHISRTDIFTAVDQLIATAAATGEDDLLVVYYTGHGFGEGIAWNYFLQPGDVDLQADDVGRADIELLQQQLVLASDLVARLEESGARYLVIFDACYEGEEARFASPVLSEEAIRNIGDVADILRFMNEFHGDNPVLFSAIPGYTVATVEIPPSVGISSAAIGPLSRRLVLADELRGSDRPSTLAEVVDALTSEKTLRDPKTAPGVTVSEPVPITLDRSLRADAIRVSMGSVATTARRSLDTSAGAQPEALLPGHPMWNVSFATMGLNGAADDYVSEGRDWVFLHPVDRFVVSEFTERELSLSLSGEQGDWSVGFSAPAGQGFGPGVFRNATRYPFQENGPGLIVSGDGRGCNEIEGSFEVTSWEETPNGGLEFAIDFQQVCDGGGGGVNGYLQMSLTLM